MHLYKTQNIKFDLIFDNVKANSTGQLVNFIEKEIQKTAISKASINNIKRALQIEHEQKGFSVFNGVLICNANIEGLSNRQTIFIRLDKEIFDDSTGQGEPINMVACTLSPARFGVINLRYLSRLTRLFRDEDLVDSLGSVDSVDGLEILLNNSLSQIDTPINNSNSHAQTTNKEISN